LGCFTSMRHSKGIAHIERIQKKLKEEKKNQAKKKLKEEEKKNQAKKKLKEEEKKNQVKKKLKEEGKKNQAKKKLKEEEKKSQAKKNCKKENDRKRKQKCDLRRGQENDELMDEQPRSLTALYDAYENAVRMHG
jgi:hypothetical protein